MNKEEFIKYLEELEIDLTKEQIEKLDKFYNLLIEWNQKINLTRIIEKDQVYLKHFYDSLTIKKVIDLENYKSLCDVGSGAGFPGIVLKIVYPNLEITLIDSLLKRVNYLNEIIKELDLENIKAIHTRAEDHKEKYDIVTARAVARLKKLTEYCLPLVKDDGYFIPMKGSVEEELEEIKSNKDIIIEKTLDFLLPIENSNRSLLLISKK